MGDESPCSEARYSYVFALKLDGTVNGQAISRVSDGHFVVCIESLSSETVAMSMDSFARVVQKCLKSCGLGIVCKEMYGGESSPLFQLLTTVPSFEAMFLKELVAQLPHFSQQLQVPLKAAVGDVTCEVKTEVYLINTLNDERMLVGLHNVDYCLDLWKKSATLGFNQVATEDDERVDHVISDGIVQPDMEVKLEELLEELREVKKNWFVFGLGLGLEGHEVEEIENDYRNQAERCKIQVLIVWGRRKGRSWSGVVKALWFIGMKKLAKDIAQKYGVPEHVTEHMQFDTPVTISDSLTVAQSTVYLTREDARSLLREREELERKRDELEQKVKALERELLELEEKDQNVIAQKEEDLKKAREDLEKAKRELKNHEEREKEAQMQLEKADIMLQEKMNVIRMLEEEKEWLNADLASQKTMTETLEKLPSYSSPDTRVSVEREFTVQLETEKANIRALNRTLDENKKSLVGLKQQIFKLQSCRNLDLAIQLRLSQLREAVSKKEKERDKVDAQLTTSSKVAQAIEESPKRLQTLCDKLHVKPRDVPVILHLKLLDAVDND